MKDDFTLRRVLELEARVAKLTDRVYKLEVGVPPEPVATASAPPPVERKPEPHPPLPAAPRESSPVPLPAPAFTSRVSPTRTAVDWETALGGNWLNRVGAFVLVVGIALLLGYSFRHMGPAGRDAVGLGAGLAMLAAGIVYERRPRYRNFARGLIGGGWAALYFTAYAMRALDAARVIHSPVAGAALLTVVAGGMIAHALRYRSEAVAGLAYFGAFGALALTEVTGFSLIALVPLAASLLYLARRFQWRSLALFGLVATWAVCASRGDTGASLWTAQAVLAIYWLLFEGFEILVPGTWLMPLNALGFLSLSLLKWRTADQPHVWAFLAVAAVVYAAGGAVRGRLHPKLPAFEGGWHGPALASAALAAAAILLRLHHQWALAGLLAVGETYYLTGLRLRSRVLRLLAIPLFALGLIRLFGVEAPTLPLRVWMPVAALTAAVFYLNRALRPADLFFGYAAAAVAALIGRYAAPARECGRVWFIMAAVPFLFGWRLRLPDFRFQGYLLATLATFGTLVTAPHPPLSAAIGAALCYALAAFAGGAGLLACPISEPELLTRSTFSVTGQAGRPAPPDRFLRNEQRWLFDIASTAGAWLLALFLHALLPQEWLGPAWALEATLLAVLVTRLRRTAVRWQAFAVASAAFLNCWIVNLDSEYTALSTAVAIACFYAAQLATRRQDRLRPFYSLLATALTTALLYYRVSGSVLTVACGVQGLALLAAGFPLRDRVLRLSGLTLLLACILKLFLYDLRHLDTFPRIVSFLSLGMILLGVSWVYTRFRERVQRYL